MGFLKKELGGQGRHRRQTDARPYRVLRAQTGPESLGRWAHECTVYGEGLNREACGLNQSTFPKTLMG